MTREEYSKIAKKLESVDFCKSEDPTMNDYDDKFRELIKNRINHCENNLKNNLHHARSTGRGQIIVWPGGHFSYPTYEALVQSLEMCIEEWSPLIWEQIIRRMADEKCTDTQMYYIASECLLLGRNF